MKWKVKTKPYPPPPLLPPLTNVMISFPCFSTLLLESPLNDASSLFNFPMSSDYGFGSEAVNLEYSIISTMLSSPTSELNPMSDLSMVENWQRQGSLDAMAHPLASNNQLQKALSAQGSLPPGQGSAAGSGLGGGGGSAGSGGAGSNINAGMNSSAASGLLGPGLVPGNNNNSNNNANSTANGGNAPTFQPPGARISKRKFPSNTPENVYANTKQPFNYTDGFHYLLRYVRER